MKTQCIMRTGDQSQQCSAVHGNSCYVKSSTNLQWEEASDFCLDLGGRLVDIHSYTENEIIRQLAIGTGRLRQQTSHVTFIAAITMHDEGQRALKYDA